MNLITKIAYYHLQTEPELTMEEWAKQLNSISKIGLRQSRTLTKSQRRNAVRTINKNGMSVVNIAEDGRVAGIPHGYMDPAQETVKLVRVDSVNDPLFLEQERHIIECGSALKGRGRTDIIAAVNRGQLTSGAVAPLIGTSTRSIGPGKSE